MTNYFVTKIDHYSNVFF